MCFDGRVLRVSEFRYVGISEVASFEWNLIMKMLSSIVFTTAHKLAPS